jgi:hypothetical protein
MTHSLETLWNVAEPLLLRHGPDATTYANVRASLRRLNELDPRSHSYRYPLDKRGDPHLVGLYNIDLGQVRSAVERLSGFLDGASSAVPDLPAARAVLDELDFDADPLPHEVEVNPRAAFD